MKKVNEVSRLAGVSKRTLQFYDDEGLLPAQRSKDNYRLYDDAALDRKSTRLNSSHVSESRMPSSA